MNIEPRDIEPIKSIAATIRGRILISLLIEILKIGLAKKTYKKPSKTATHTAETEYVLCRQ